MLLRLLYGFFMVLLGFPQHDGAKEDDSFLWGGFPAEIFQHLFPAFPSMRKRGGRSAGLFSFIGQPIEITERRPRRMPAFFGQGSLQRLLAQLDGMGKIPLVGKEQGIGQLASQSTVLGEKPKSFA